MQVGTKTTRERKLSGSSSDTRAQVLQESAVYRCVHWEIEPSKREQHAEDVWHSFRAEWWRVSAEEAVKTETEEKDVKREQGWTKGVRKKKGLRTYVGVLVALNQGRETCQKSL